ANHLRAICRQHAHVIRSVSDELDDRGSTGSELFEPSTRAVPVPSVYIIDDDTSMRRSLGRLLGLFSWPVRTFDSADSFLAELNELTTGCLILDIQLLGMSGLELMVNLINAKVPWPVIAMSGEHDEKAEAEALRLGARAFLRKPFEPQVLLDTIAQAL